MKTIIIQPVTTPLIAKVRGRHHRDRTWHEHCDVIGLVVPLSVVAIVSALGVAFDRYKKSQPAKYWGNIDDKEADNK